MSAEAAPPLMIGRYAIYDEVAAGGMATVHFGRLVGPAGFSRTVAVKRLHPTYARDPEFVAMFLDEARLCGRVRHPNVASMLDVVATRGELFLVMEYVLGDSLSRLARSARARGETVPTPIVSAVIANVLHGLHAAHEARGERGELLDIIHRDVSPQNVLVGVDGLARVVDFGVAKASGRLQTSRDGQIKGKLAYMAPEQLRSSSIDRRVDVYAASVVLWELLAGRRLFEADSEGGLIGKILEEPIAPPSSFAGPLADGLDELVLRGLERRPSRRFDTARDMALALEACVRPALPSEVASWVEHVAGEVVRSRAARIRDIESATSTKAPIDVVSAMSEPDTEDRTWVEPHAAAIESESTQLSSSASRPNPERGARRPLATIAVVLLGGAAIATWALSRAPAAAPPPSSAAVASEAPVVSTPSESTPSAITAVAPSTSTTASASASASGSASAPSVGVAAKPRPASPKPTSKTTSVPTGKLPPGAGNKAGCYTVDGAGIWHIKPECL